MTEKAGSLLSWAAFSTALANSPGDVPLLCRLGVANAGMLDLEFFDGIKGRGRCLSQRAGGKGGQAKQSPTAIKVLFAFITVRPLHTFVAFLSLNGQGCDGPRLKAFDADGVAGFFAIAVFVVSDALQRFINFAD